MARFFFDGRGRTDDAQIPLRSLQTVGRSDFLWAWANNVVVVVTGREEGITDIPLDKLRSGHVRSDIAFSGKGFKRRNSFKWPLEKYFALNELS